MKTLKVDNVIGQCDFSKIDRKRVAIIGTECLAKSVKHEIEEIMDKRYYSLIIDEVSGDYGNGYLGRCIRYLGNDSHFTKFYRLINMENDCSAAKIKHLLDETILISQKRKKDLT